MAVTREESAALGSGVRRTMGEKCPFWVGRRGLPPAAGWGGGKLAMMMMMKGGYVCKSTIQTCRDVIRNINGILSSSLSLVDDDALPLFICSCSQLAPVMLTIVGLDGCIAISCHAHVLRWIWVRMIQLCRHQDLTNNGSGRKLLRLIAQNLVAQSDHGLQPNLDFNPDE